MAESWIDGIQVLPPRYPSEAAECRCCKKPFAALQQIVVVWPYGKDALTFCSKECASKEPLKKEDVYACELWTFGSRTQARASSPDTGQ